MPVVHALGITGNLRSYNSMKQVKVLRISIILGLFCSLYFCFFTQPKICFLEILKRECMLMSISKF